jgi:hypothetical protein
VQDEAMIRRTLVAAVVLVIAFAAVTLFALEGREVVVLRTRDAAGGERATRTWIADAAGAAWIEAATPERPFLRDLEREPALFLDRHGRPQRCRTSVAPNPEGHARIRALLATKYGWADRWIAMVADTQRSLAVRLDCDDLDPAARAG